jgi:hypothetical protein
MKNLQFVISLICLLGPVIKALSQEFSWDTYYEKSSFKKTPSYKETIDYSKRLADFSEIVTYKTFGVSPQGRNLGMLIADKSGKFDIQNIGNGSKALVLIQACIHAGESDGKDAGLMLLRDMIVRNQHLDVLDNITIIFIPIFNADGHENFSKYNRINQNGPEEMGWRATAQRLNLNRDYLKADAPEMRALIGLYQQVLPDFYIDCHVTDGADYVYPLTYGLQMQGNLDMEQTNWLKDTYLPFVTEKMKNTSQPIAPYMDFVEWHNPAQGIKAYYETPRYSGGYAAVNNRPALLIETHMLKDYRTRVTATYNMLLYSLQIISDNAAELKKLNIAADNKMAKFEPGDSYTLTYRIAENGSKFLYQGYDYSIAESNLTGGRWYKYSKNPKSIEIDYFSREPDIRIKIPKAYIIPVQWKEIIDKLELHNVQFETLLKDTLIDVGTYAFENVKWASRPFEGRIRLEYNVNPIQKEMKFPKGSKIVYLNQRAAQLAFHLLEPEAPDALVRWGFLNSIFEQKEYAESYVMEKMAREMLEKDHKLKEKFEDKFQSDEAFANNSWAILNWFYQKTPYWDDQIGVYPIGRIME